MAYDAKSLPLIVQVILGTLKPSQTSVTLPGQNVILEGGMEDKLNIGLAGGGGGGRRRREEGREEKEGREEAEGERRRGRGGMREEGEGEI